jgi:hypothetical protein
MVGRSSCRRWQRACRAERCRRSQFATVKVTGAINLYDSGAGPLSPNVFWRRDGTWETVSRLGPDGEVTIILGEDLRRLLDQLAR